MWRSPLLWFVLTSALLTYLARANIISLKNLIASIGYEAKSHRLVSQGYILSVVQATNPKVNRTRGPSKAPVLFVHGSLTNAKSFLLNVAREAAPEDWSDLDAAKMSAEELKEAIGEHPAGKNLITTLLNMGFEVWMLNNRGSQDSLGHVDPDFQPFLPNEWTDLAEQSGLLSAFRPLMLEQSNPRYWNYSYHEPALFDLPAAIDLVINKTGHKRISLVGLSAGGAQILMALSRLSSLAEKRK